MDKLKNKIQKYIDQLNVDEPNASTWNGIKNELQASLKNDSLKKHIVENRNDLDVEIPAARSWENIKTGREEKPVLVLRIKKRILYLSAACIVVIASLGILRYTSTVNTSPEAEVVQTNPFNNSNAGKKTNFENQKNDLVIKQSLPDKTIKATSKEKNTAVAAAMPKKKQKNSLLPPGVRQIEKDYNELITAQLKYTKSLAIYGESAGYFEQFKNDFKTLERKEKELRTSIIRNGLQENSITELAMIYQEKLTVLKKLQNEINKTSTRNKNVTDTIAAYINL